MDEEFAKQSYYFQGLPAQDQEGNTITWREAKATMLARLAWGGLPQIELTGCTDGRLELTHHHDGRDLQLGQAAETLLNLSGVWGGPVRLETLEEGQPRVLVCEDGEVRPLDTAGASDQPAPEAAAG